MTTVFIMRHSKVIERDKIELNTTDSVQLINEKNILSVDGEKLAEKVSVMEEFTNLDAVYSSNYVRAILTAKYFANRNNQKIIVDERLKERVQGIKKWDELPKNFEEKQFYDENYKIGDGENQLEVRKRMEEVVDEILETNKDKKVIIISHATAISFLLKRWCNIEYQGNYCFHNKTFFDGKWNYCTSFKMFFDGKKLLKIEEVKM